MKLSENQSFDQILESAVVVSWEDLMHGVQTGLIHIEYSFAAGDTLDDLRIWSSITRGHWLLACEYWMSASSSHISGVRFDNGYHSERLAHRKRTKMSKIGKNQTFQKLVCSISTMR